MFGASTSTIGGRAWSGIQGTSDVGWPRPTIGGTCPRPPTWLWRGANRKYYLSDNW